MRITFILPRANLSGGIKVVAIYADRLRQRGHRVTLISRSPRTPTVRSRVKSILTGRGWPRTPEAGPTHLDGLDLEHSVVPAGRALTDADVPDADAVIATWWETAPWVARLSPSKGAKLYFMQDYGAPGMELADLIPTWRLPLRLITISKFLVDLIREHTGREAALVPNGVDPAQFHAPPRGKRAVPTVGFLYNIGLPEKRAGLLLEACLLAGRELADEGGLRVVGFGPRPPTADHAEHPVFQRDGGGGFQWRAPNEALPGIYAACDAWLFGTSREGFGLPVLEAFACRTPVIATPAGAAPQLLQGGGGLPVPFDDPAAMSRAIIRIARMSEEEWRALSDRALATARRYTWDAATDALEAVVGEEVEKVKH